MCFASLFVCLNVCIPVCVMTSRGVALSHNAAVLGFWSSGVHEIGESARRNEAERDDSRRIFISQLNTHTHRFKPTITSETCGSATSRSSREACDFLPSIKPLNPEDFSPVGRFAPSRQWQRPPQPRSRWETGCCRPSIARAMWVTRSLSRRPSLGARFAHRKYNSFLYLKPHRALEFTAKLTLSRASVS